MQTETRTWFIVAGKPEEMSPTKIRLDGTLADARDKARELRKEGFSVFSYQTTLFGKDYENDGSV